MDKELDNTRSVDQDSLSKARNTTMKFDFCLPEEIDARNFIDEFSQSTHFIPRFKSDDSFGFVVLKNSNAYASDIVIKAVDVLDFRHSRTPKENLILKCRVLYGWDEGNQTYTRETNPHGDGGVPTNVENYIEYYNVRNINDYYLEMESKFIKDDYTAIQLRDYLVNFGRHVHNVIECDLPVKYMMLEVGDIVEFDSLISDLELFGADYTQATEIGYTDSSGVFNSIGLHTKHFIITSTMKSLNKVSVTLIQITNDDIIQNTNVVSDFGYIPNFMQGDLNQDNYVDVLDIVILVQAIMDSDTDSLPSSADYNSDGLVNILDCVQIVNEIVS